MMMTKCNNNSEVQCGGISRNALLRWRPCVCQRRRRRRFRRLLLKHGAVVGKGKHHSSFIYCPKYFTIVCIRYKDTYASRV